MKTEDWSDECISQGMSKMATKVPDTKKGKERFFLQVLEGAGP